MKTRMLNGVQSIRNEYRLGLVSAARVYFDKGARSYALGERTNSDNPMYRTLVGGPSQGLGDATIDSRRYLRFLELSGKDTEGLKEMRELDEQLDTMKRRRGGAYLPQSKEEGEAMLRLFMLTSEPYDIRKLLQDSAVVDQLGRTVSFFHQISRN